MAACSHLKRVNVHGALPTTSCPCSRLGETCHSAVLKVSFLLSAARPRNHFWVHTPTCLQSHCEGFLICSPRHAA